MRTTRRYTRAGIWLLFGLLMAVVTADNVIGFTADGAGQLAYNAALVAAGGVCLWRCASSRHERLAWALIASGILAWAGGNIYWSVVLAPLEVQPFPSFADALWLAFYPPVYVAIGLLVRSRLGRFPLAVWLDGVIAASAVAALGTAVFLPRILASTGGDTAAVATNLAYPLADLTLLGFVVGIAAVTRLQNLTWLLTAAGLGVFAVTDAIYVYQVAGGTYVVGTVLDLGWVAAPALLAVAAWTRARGGNVSRLDGWGVVVVPALFALVALAIQIYNHYHRVSTLTLALASVAIALVVGRLILTFGEYVHMLRRSQTDAVTDALTGLPNRRALLDDLAKATAFAAERPHVLVMYDLDGFKGYNDAFGHFAGDALLQRLSRKLAAATPSNGCAYRLGGDEFCLLAPAHDRADADSIARVSAEELSERGQRFAVSASYGAVLIPADANTATDALRLSDTRMYQHKARRPSVARQVRAALVSALDERDRALRSHGDDVARLAVAVGRELGLARDECEELGFAAELHDVGKLGIPDSILASARSLTEEDWSFIRQHTVIGERIVSSTPALARIAPVIRAGHENWDGTGYPDGIAGEAIPLAARIIFVCDAYEAMTSPRRPYRDPITPDEAVDELRACAGTQFDPEVVAAFAAAITNARQPLAIAS